MLTNIVTRGDERPQCNVVLAKGFYWVKIYALDFGIQKYHNSKSESKSKLLILDVCKLMPFSFKPLFLARSKIRFALRATQALLLFLCCVALLRAKTYLAPC